MDEGFIREVEMKGLTLGAELPAQKVYEEICPRVMHLIVIEECRECSYYKGEVKRQKQEPGIQHTSDTESIHCDWDWDQIPVPLRPLFKGAHWEEIRQPVAAEVKEVESPA